MKKKNLEQIAKEDMRYSMSAIRFVYEGLGYTAKNVATEPKQVSGQTLCDGLKKLAIEKFPEAERQAYLHGTK